MNQTNYIYYLLCNERVVIPQARFIGGEVCGFGKSALCELPPKL